MGKEVKNKKKLDRASTILALTTVTGNLLISSGIPMVLAEAKTKSSEETTSSTYDRNKRTFDIIKDFQKPLVVPKVGVEPKDSLYPPTIGATEDSKETEEEVTEDVDENQWVKDMFPYLTSEEDIQTASTLFNQDGSIKINVLGYQGELSLFLNGKYVSLETTNPTGTETLLSSTTKDNANHDLLVGEEAVKHLVTTFQGSTNEMVLIDTVGGKELKTRVATTSSPLLFTSFVNFYNYTIEVKSVVDNLSLGKKENIKVYSKEQLKDEIDSISNQSEQSKIKIGNKSFEDYSLEYNAINTSIVAYTYETFDFKESSNGSAKASLDKTKLPNPIKDLLTQLEINENVIGLPYKLNLEMNNDKVLTSFTINGESVRPVSDEDGKLQYNLPKDYNELTVDVKTSSLSSLGYSEVEPKDVPISVTYKDKELEAKTFEQKDITVKETLSNLENKFFIIRDKDGKEYIIENSVKAISKNVNTKDLDKDNALPQFKNLTSSYSYFDKDVSKTYLIAVSSEKPNVSNIALDKEPTKVTLSNMIFDEAPTLTFSASSKIDLDKAVLTLTVNKKDVEVTKDLTGNSSDVSFLLRTGKIKSLKVYDKAGNVEDVNLKDSIPNYRKGILITGNSLIEVNSSLLGTTTLDKKEFINKEPTLNVKATSKQGDSKLVGYSILLNDEEVHYEDLSSNPVESVDANLNNVFKDLKEGQNTIMIVAENSNGETSAQEIFFYYDKSAPTIQDAVITSKEYAIEDKVLVVTGSLDIKVKATDVIDGLTEEDVSGLGNMRIVNKDTNDSFAVEPKNGIYDISISGNGTYSFQLVDKLSNTTKEFTLGELIDSINDDINSVMIYKAESKIELTTKDPDYSTETKDFYGQLEEIESLIENQTAIKKWSILLNGNVVHSKEYNAFESLFKPTTSIKQLIDKKDVEDNLGEDGKLSIFAEVETFSHYKKFATKTMYFDLNPPKVDKLNITGEYFNETDGIYSKTPLKLEVISTDGLDSSGMAYSQVNLDGKQLKKEDNSNIVAFNSSSKGIYSFISQDNVGHTSKEVGVKDLNSDLKTETFIVDSEKPKASINVGKPQYSNNGKDWYNSEVPIEVKSSDNEALHSVKVTVNGKSAISESYDKTKKEDSFKINTKDFERNSDGSYNIETVVTDKARNEVVTTKTVYVDDVAPEITDFIFQQDGYLEGKTLITDFDSYGFYFKNATTLVVTAKDEGASSGLKQLDYQLGNMASQTIDLSSGSATISIPQDFKGHIKALPVDNVGNSGSSKNPDGIITETSSMHVNSSVLAINLPETPYKTASGQLLFNHDVSVGYSALNSFSGLREVATNNNGNNATSSSINNSGLVTGSPLEKTNTDKNLVTGVKSNITYTESVNNQKVTLTSKDRAGYDSSLTKEFSIDKIAPVLTLSYDNNDSDGKYFNKNRVATLTIKEVNFNANDVKFTGNVPTGISWSSNGDTHTATIPFVEDKEYKWGVEYTDLAGNPGNKIEQQDFVIDKTAPVIKVAYDNNDVHNKNFYNKPRVATITVEETNFTPDRVKVDGATLSGWSSNGGTHTATATFSENKEHQWSMQVTDLARNVSETYKSESFIIDTEKPKLDIKGVTDGASYKKDVFPIITYSDKNLDQSTFSYTLVGKKNGKMNNINVSSSEDGKVILTNIPKQKEFDDIYTLTANVEDKAGNKSTETVVFMINRFGSDFKLLDTTFFDMQYVQNVTKDIIIEETSVVPMNLDKTFVEVTRNGKEMTLDKKSNYTITETSDEKDFKLYTYKVNKDVFKDEGVYSIYVRSTDKDDNINDTRDLKMTFAVDRTKPKVFISNVASGKVYNEDSKEVTIEARDNLALDKTTVTLNGVDQNATFTEGKTTLTLKSSDNPYTLEVVSTDKAKNVEKQTIDDFYISTNLGLRVAKWKGTAWLLGVLGAIGVGVLGFASYRYLLARKRKEEENVLNQEILEKEHSGSFDDTDSDSRIDLHSGEVLGGASAVEATEALNSDEEPTDLLEESDETENLDSNEEGTDLLDEEQEESEDDTEKLEEEPKE